MKYFIIATNNDISFSEMIKECQKDSWCPLLILKDGDQTLIPCSNVSRIAKEYAKRNLKGQISGIVTMTENDVQRMQEEFIQKLNWKFKIISFPNKERLEKDIAIHYFVNQPDIYGFRNNSLVKESIT